MSAKLIQNPDGANFQARAVLEMVRCIIGGGIEASWNDDRKCYDAEPNFTRFDNCREQGYVIYLSSKDYSKQINIAFYEHRNSDRIYIQVNDKHTFNAPVLDDITESMSDKWDCAFSAGWGKVSEAAKFIVDKLDEFWDANSPKK